MDKLKGRQQLRCEYRYLVHLGVADKMILNHYTKETLGNSNLDEIKGYDCRLSCLKFFENFNINNKWIQYLKDRVTAVEALHLKGINKKLTYKQNFQLNRFKGELIDIMMGGMY